MCTSKASSKRDSLTGSFAATSGGRPSSNPPLGWHLSRRSFLRRGAVVMMGGLAMPSILPAGILGAGQQPGANDRITLGFIGVGRQGADLLNFISRMPAAKILAVADVDWPRALQVASRVEGTQAYQDYRRILDRADIDAIVTATPEQWRGPICVHSCQAGKDLYVEKPMSLTVREGRMIVRAVQRYGRVFQTGSQQRSMEPNRRGCELIRNGRLGKIHRVIAHNYPSPWDCGLPAQTTPAGLDWEQWCGPAVRPPFHPDIYAPRANPGWLSFQPFSGGEMTGWGSHGFDQVHWALGFDNGGPIEIWTEGDPLRPPIYHKPESRDRGNAVCSQPKVFFRYPGEIVMELGDGPQGGAIFIGDHGSLRIDRAICRSEPADLAEEPLENPSIPFRRSRNHVQDWFECIRTRSKPIAYEEIGHRTATVCHLGNIARYLGRRLRWDPVAELFDGDSEANGMLDRPRRKGYEINEIG